MNKFILNGENIKDSASFMNEFYRAAKINYDVAEDIYLDRFNDQLFQYNHDFGRSIFIIKNSNIMHKTLGYEQTLKRLENQLIMLKINYPDNINSHTEKGYNIAACKRRRGQTIFSEIVGIILGNEEIELILE